MQYLVNDGKYKIRALTEIYFSVTDWEMAIQIEIGDVIESAKQWEIYLNNWLDILKKAKQPMPEPSQIESLREIWLEGFMVGRLTK